MIAMRDLPHRQSLAVILILTAAACAPAPPPCWHGPQRGGSHGAPQLRGVGRLFISPMGEPFRGGGEGGGGGGCGMRGGGPGGGQGGGSPGGEPRRGSAS
jgi:hypothetical protein